MIARLMHKDKTADQAIGKVLADPFYAVDLRARARRREIAPEAEISFPRIAVTEEQITTMSLPTRPTKTTDSPAKNFTGESVEVDAIPTTTLRVLVREAIERHIDPVALDATRLFEAEERAGLEAMARGWSA